MGTKMSKFFTLAIGASLLGLSTVSAQDFIVNNAADVPDSFPGDGICNPINSLPGTCTLRAAIMEANALGQTHVIALATDIYSLSNVGENEDNALIGDLDIKATIRIINGTQNAPLIDGNSTDRIFDVHSGGWLMLKNIDLAFGSANTPFTARGGAVQVRGDGRLTMEASQAFLNTASMGGAIYNDGRVSIVQSEFSNNAILPDQVLPTFSNGAAILNRGQLNVNASSFISNGKIPGFEGTLPPSAFAIHSRKGFVSLPYVNIKNSTFWGNTNGVYSDKVATWLSLVTMANNNQRGVVFIPDINNPDEVQVSIWRTVIYGHTVSDCSNLDPAQPFVNTASNRNASSDESCGFTGQNDFQNISYPFFDAGPADNGGRTLTLLPKSNGVLIDVPGWDWCSAGIMADQRREKRLVDGDGSGVAECDIGAVEYQPGLDPRSIR